MKKILSILALLTIILAFGSCSLNSVFKKNPEANTYSGLIVEQTPDDDYAGSHILVDENGDIVTPIRSLTINLSSSKYLNNKVQIIGEKNKDDGVFEVSGISVLEVINPDNLKREFTEYKNTDFGFRLKYYSDWKVEELGNVLTFIAPSENEAMDMDKIVITQSPFQYEVEPVVQENVVEPEIGAELEVPVVDDRTVAKEALKSYAEQNSIIPSQNFDNALRKIGPDKMVALKTEGSDNKTDYYLYRSGFIYQISFVPAKTAPIVENKNIFNEMLSEFQFLGFTVEDNEDVGGFESDEDAEEKENTENVSEEELDMTNSEVFTVNVEGMTSFESSLYHFSAVYPKDWYYAGVKGTGSGVLHHYGFSNKPVEGSNELIGLDLLSESSPDGQTTSGNTFTAYKTVDGRTYKITGDVEYKDVITTMAQSITPIKSENP